MRSSNALTALVASLACANCFQQSFNQLSISDSQANDTKQASAGTTAESASSSTTGSVTSGGASQTGGASGSTTTALSVTSDAGTTVQVEESVTSSTAEGTSTAGSSGETTAGQTDCDDLRPFQFDGECYGLSEIRLVFVTNKAFKGNMDDPDTLCKEAAEAADLPGTYKAWATTKNGSPAARFDTAFKGPYAKLDPHIADSFILVAMGWNELTTNDLRASINVTELGKEATGFAWTGTARDGLTDESLPNCKQWSKENPLNLWASCEGYKRDYGIVGKIDDTSLLWSNLSHPKCGQGIDCCFGIKFSISQMFECNQENPLYCFQQTPGS
jgi:hypothetical protein